MVSEPRFSISGMFKYFFSLGFVGFSCSAHSRFHLGGVFLFSASSAHPGRFLLLFPVPFFGCGFRHFIIFGVWSIMSSDKLEAFPIRFTCKNYSAWEFQLNYLSKEKNCGVILMGVFPHLKVPRLCLSGKFTMLGL